jgi:hypothetical protein
VAKALQACTSCHSQPPISGTPMALVTRDDLMASSGVDSAQTYAQRAVVRMKDSKSPMPPLPASAAPAADIATLQAWIDGGMPKGDCGAAANPFNAPPKCSSAKYWAMGDEGTGLMHPGAACVACHVSRKKAPAVQVGGTVYPSAHEPDECISLVPGAKVVLTDATGAVVTLPLNANGNFYYDQDPLAFPYSAKVVFEGRERVMIAKQTSGDCNACHTQAGASSAPGRILLP